MQEAAIFLPTVFLSYRKQPKPFITSKGNTDVSPPYEPPGPATGIALPTLVFFFNIITSDNKCLDDCRI
jgi:hypothetical protein